MNQPHSHSTLGLLLARRLHTRRHNQHTTRLMRNRHRCHRRYPPTQCRRKGWNRRSYLQSIEYRTVARIVTSLISVPS